MKPSYEFKRLCLILLVGVLILSWAGCSGSGNSNNPKPEQLRGYPISSEVLTTRERTVVPDPIPSPSPTILPYQVALYEQSGLGKWHYGPPVDAGKQTTIMPSTYTGATAVNAARLLNFFVITDVHICDKESPCTSIFFGYKGGGSSSYSAVILYTTQVLDAAVQTINALHRKTPFDFGMALGDDCDNTETVELRWFMDALDGQDINPATGVGIKQDPIPGPYNDYQDRYKAAGLDKSIKWYQAIGNHDHFWKGSWPVNDYTRQTYLGADIINLGDPITSMSPGGFYMGTVDGRTPYGNIIGAGPQSDFKKPPQTLAADPRRNSLVRNDWIGEFFNTTSGPVGHGFSQDSVTSGFACYSFEPKAGMPVKVIVLDDTQSETMSSNQPYAFGYLDEERFEWLGRELDKGQAEGKLMIVASHVPIAVNTDPVSSTQSIWSADSPITMNQLLAKLHTYPNLLLWIAGHRHCNQVTPLPSPDTSHPEMGFWEVETSSLRDYPQQFREIELLRNADNTISIKITDVDPAVADGSLAAISRSYAIASQELFQNAIGNLPSGSYNAELIKQLSPEMQTKIQNYGTPIK